MNKFDIEWRTTRGLSGDSHTLLVGTLNDKVESRLFKENSLFDTSFKRAKRKITKRLISFLS